MVRALVTKMLAALAVLFGAVSAFLSVPLLVDTVMNPNPMSPPTAAFGIVVSLIHLIAGYLALFSFEKSSVRLLSGVCGVWVWYLGNYGFSFITTARHLPDDLLLENGLVFGPILAACIVYQCCFRLFVPRSVRNSLFDPSVILPESVVDSSTHRS